MALTKVTGGILSQPIDLGITTATTGFFSGIVTAQSVRVLGDLTVDGSTTTLDTVVTEVDRLEVGANNTTVGVAITQSGTGDILKLYDSSTPVFVVKDGGRVGIGTDNPTAELDIEGAAARIHLHDYDDNQAQIIQNGNALYLNVDSEGNGDGSLRVRMGGSTGDQEKLRIDSSGRVGIGTNNPGTDLHISGSGAGQNSLRIDSSTTAISFNNHSEFIGYIGNDSGKLFINAVGTERTLSLRTNYNERVHITSTGRVGIGTTDPSATGLAVYRDDTGLGNIVDIVQDGTGDAVLGFAIKGTAAWQFGIDNSDSDKFKISYDGSGLDSSTSVTLDRTGRVGIGTDAPARDFHVTGTSRFEQLDVVGFATFGSAGTRFFHHTPRIEMPGNSTATLSFVNATTGTTTSDGMLMGFSSSSASGFINVLEGGHGFVLKTGGSGVGNERINISGVGTVSLRYGTTEEMVTARPNAAVELYFNGNKRLETTGTGVDITDNLSVSGVSTFTGRIDASNDITITSGNRLYFGNSDVAFIKGEHGGSAYLALGANTEQVRITRAGTVGIGTDDPNVKLEVFKSSNDSIIKAKTSAAGAYFEADSAITGYHGIRLSSSGTEKWFLGSYNSANFQIKDGSAASGDEIFTIKDGTGNVGIGTNNPGAKLDVRGNIIIQNTYPSLFLFDVDHNDDFSIQNQNGIFAVRDETNNENRLNIDSTGNVGIGTDSPSEKLDVKGHIVVAETVATNRPRIILSAPNQGSSAYRHLFGANLKVDNSGTFTNPATNISGGGWEYLAANSINTYGHMRYISAPDTNSSSSTPLERLRIDSNGRILIGHDSTPAASLSVAIVGSYGASTNNTPFVYLCRDQVSQYVTGNESLGQILFASKDGYRGAVIEANAAGTWSGSSSDGYLVFKTTPDNTTVPTEKLRITSDGDLIHTSTNKTLSLVTTQNVNGAGTKIAFFGANRYDTDEEFASIKGGLTTNSGGSGKQGGYLEFTVGTGSNKVRFDGNGNVGIATDSPDEKLHVYNGAGNVTSFVEAVAGDALLKLSNTGNGNYSGIDFLRERSSGTGIPGGSIFMKSDTVDDKAHLYIQTQSASANSGVTGALSANNGVRLILRGADGIFSIENGASESLRIDSSGHIKIPDDAEIRLGGAQTTTGVIKIYSESGTSDMTHIDATSGNGKHIRFIDSISGSTQTELYFGNAQKLSTQPGGILVQGTVSGTTGLITNNDGDIEIGTRSRISAASGTCFVLENSNSGGDEVLRVTSDGDIYTSNDQVRDNARLTLTKPAVGISTILMLHNSNGSATAAKISSSKGLVLSADFDNNSGAGQSFISFEVNANEKLLIASDGTVGVNCTPIGLPLEVKQFSADGGALRLRDASATYRYLDFDVTDSLTSITARSNNSHGSINIGTLDQYGRTTQLYIKGGATAKVGIGTDNPECTSHFMKASAGSVSADGNAVLAIENNNHCVFNMLSPTDKSSYIMMGDPDDISAGQIRYDNNIDVLLIDVNGGEKLRILKNGEFYVGVQTFSASHPEFAVNVGPSNLHGVTIHSDTAENDGDLAGLAFSHGSNGASIARSKAAIGFRCDNTGYGRGDLCFYVDGTSDNNSVSSADERVRIMNNGAIAIGTDNAIRGPVHIHQNSNNDVQIHLSNNETGATSSGRGFTIFGGAGTSGRDMGFVNRETTGAIEFYTNQNGTLAQRGGWHTGIATSNSITTFCINTASNGTHSNFIVSNHDITDYNGIANRNEYPIFTDIHLTGSDAVSGGNKTKSGWRHDVENTINNNTSNTSGERLQIYGIYSTLNSSKYSYIQYGGYFFANSSPDNAPRTQTVIACYGYAQGYAASNSPDKTMNIYGGHFIGYRGGNTSGGHTFGVLGRAHQITNGSNKTGDLTGVYGEAECDDGLVTNAYAFRALIDVDDETASGNEKAEISNAYLYHGSYAIESTVGAAVTNKRGIWLTGCTDNYLAGDLEITGNITATNNKSFRIPHPLVGLTTTKDLVHTAIEGPQVDLIYRGKTTLVAGISTINIDTKAGMTEGTFVALNRDVQCFTTNETGWTNVKGSVTGNQLTIIAQENTCIDTISWMVIGERQDDSIKGSTSTDADGKLILEPDKKPVVESIANEHEEDKDISNPDGDINPAYE